MDGLSFGAGRPASILCHLFLKTRVLGCGLEVAGWGALFFFFFKQKAAGGVCGESFPPVFAVKISGVVTSAAWGVPGMVLILGSVGRPRSYVIGF